MSRPKIWSSSSGEIEIPLYKKEYMSLPRIGPADSAINELYKQSNIVSRFDKYDDETIANVLTEYGAWEPSKLTNREDNIKYILWIACNDLIDQM